MTSAGQLNDAGLNAASDGGKTRITPGPEGLVAPGLPFDPIEFLGNLIDRYGEVVRYRSKISPVFFFVNPDHVQTILHRENYGRNRLIKLMLGEGLIASEGPYWRSQRRLMQPEFFPPRVSPFVPVMSDEAARVAREWQQLPESVEIDLAQCMSRLTLRIVTKSLFSHDLSELDVDQLGEAVAMGITGLGMLSWTIFNVPVNIAPDTAAKFAQAKGLVDSLCLEMINNRKACPPEGRPRDLLTFLIEAQTPDGPLNDVQLRDEIVTLLNAGSETSGLSVAWAWKELAAHPEVEARLHNEVDSVLAGAAPTLDDIPKLPFTTAVLQETMRLYPPVWYLPRIAQNADVIDGHLIPRGAAVLVSAWFTHRHKAFWAKPDEFDPNRFLPPATVSHRYAFFPFGGGRHHCMGVHFAMLEGIIVLAQLAQQFSVRPTNAGDVKPSPGITLRQLPSLRGRVLRRVPLSAVAAPSRCKDG